MSYEDSIKKRRHENRELLKTLGIFSLRQEYQVVKNPETSKSPKKYLRKVSKSSKPTFKASDLIPTRKSSRLLGKEPPKFFEDSFFDDDEDVDYSPKIKRKHPLPKYQPPKERIKRENSFGAIPGVPVGTEFSTRMEASHAGIHRPPVSGIHGNPLVGCYSLALSGGYEDDVDLGDSFIYTGEGGRDLRGTKTNPKNLRTAPQSKDQVLERGNLALAKNVENNLPVRVLRGYKLKSRYAPEEGYRYDGLYNVVEYYLTPGLSGFKVYKFRMERIKDQEPAPWSEDFIIPKTSDNVEMCSEKENVPEEDQPHNEKPDAFKNLKYFPEKEETLKENQLQTEKEEISNGYQLSPKEENNSEEDEQQKESEETSDCFSQSPAEGNASMEKNLL